MIRRRVFNCISWYHSTGIVYNYGNAAMIVREHRLSRSAWHLGQLPVAHN